MTVMLNNTEAQTLGMIIGNRNFYPQNRAAALAASGGPATTPLMLLAGLTAASPIEQDSYEVGHWMFKNRSLRIAKAIRIPYNYIDENGNMVLEHILVGYEGEGGE